VFTIVAVIAVFNVVAYLHVKDWSSIGVFVLAGAVTFSVTRNRTLAVVAAVIAGSLFRASNNLMQEGMASKPKKKAKKAKPQAKPKQKVPVKEPGKFDAFLGAEGMSSQLDELQNNQAVLTNGIRALEPLMKQASSMLKGLPSGFLDEALKKFAKNNGQI
jgi:hypothetical protein